MKVRTLPFLLALAFVALLPTTPARAGDAASDLAAHRAYTGWSYGDGSIATLAYTDTATRDKDASIVSTSRILRIGAVYRQDTTETKSTFTIHQGFTGNVFWSTNQNGMTVPIIGDQAKEELATDLFVADALASLPWVARGTQDVNGTPTDVYRVTQANAFPVDLYVDPATGAYKRAVIDPGGEYELGITILGYSDVSPGKKIVAKFKYDGSAVTYTNSAFKVNGIIADSALHPPAQTAVWKFGTPAAIPLEVTAFRLKVHASINGVPGTFILDTGADGIFLSSGFAARAKLKDLGTAMAQGIAGSLTTHTARADTVTIGDNTLNNVLLTYGGKGGDSDGLIGYDLFGAAVVTLDISNGTIEVADPSTVDITTIPGVHVVADLSSGQPSVPMKVNGGATISTILDTGAPINVLIASHFLYDHKIPMLVDNTLEGYFQSLQVGAGVSGAYEIEQCGSLDTLTLGPIIYQSPRTCKSGSFSGNNGLVGLEFLKQFAKIVLDYPQSTIVFVPKQP